MDTMLPSQPLILSTHLFMLSASNGVHVSIVSSLSSGKQ